MKIKIRNINVKEIRNPYYIKCSICENEIEGISIEEVVEISNKEGWKYEDGEDNILCNECLGKEAR